MNMPKTVNTHTQQYAPQLVEVNSLRAIPIKKPINGAIKATTVKRK
jgi:hypothetical protein